MSSLVKYNNKFLVPISDVTISHSMGQNKNNQCTRPTYQIDLNGTLIYNAGSPTSSGTFGNYTADQCEMIDSDERLNALLGKHCALGTLFSENFKELELGTTTGSPNLTAYPRVLSLALTDTTNPSFWKYTISLEADNLYCSGVPIGSTGCKVKSFDETWEITYDEVEVLGESGDNRLFRLSHSISAVGVGLANSGGLLTEPYLDAKDFVCGKKGNNAIIPAVCIDGFNASGDIQYNYFESHSTDIPNGTYSLTESWINCTGNHIENYSVEIQDGSDQACPTVSIQGAIRGFEVRIGGSVPATGSKYYNANQKFISLESTSGIYNRAQDLSGYTLDFLPMNSSIGRNIFTGEITYNNTYRKLPFKWLPSAKFEKVSVSNTWNNDMFATISILGLGEVIHPIFMNSSGVIVGHKNKTRSLNIDATYPCGTGISRLGPRWTAPYGAEIQAVVDYYHPSGLPSTYLTMVNSQQETWDPQLGTYQYSIEFTYQDSGICNF